MSASCNYNSAIVWFPSSIPIVLSMSASNWIPLIAQQYLHILDNLVGDDFDVTRASTLPEIHTLGRTAGKSTMNCT